METRDVYPRWGFSIRSACLSRGGKKILSLENKKKGNYPFFFA
jgi:hypothetical protein